METHRRRVAIYQDAHGKEPFNEWVSSLSRTDRARVVTRLDRIETGNLGDCKPVGDGVFELRLHFGAGYRIYFGEVERMIILLLCGGDKSSQDTDIQHAKAYWKHYKTTR